MQAAVFPELLAAPPPPSLARKSLFASATRNIERLFTAQNIQFHAHQQPDPRVRSLGERIFNSLLEIGVERTLIQQGMTLLAFQTPQQAIDSLVPDAEGFHHPFVPSELEQALCQICSQAEAKHARPIPPARKHTLPLHSRFDSFFDDFEDSALRHNHRAVTQRMLSYKLESEDNSPRQ